MAQKIRFQVLRVTSANRASITPAQGEFLWETDTLNLYVGDGTTAGGNLIESAGGSIVTSVNGNTGTVVLDASDISFTPTGDIVSTNTQAAIAEVRDDTDTKLALKEDSANKGSASGYAPLDSDTLVPFVNLPLYSETQNDTNSASTTSPTLSTAHTYTTGTVQAGTYMLHVFMVIEPNSTSNNYIFQWRVNTVDQGPVLEEEGKDVQSDNRNWRSGFFPITLTAGSHTIDVQFASESGTLVLHESRFFVQRIS